MTQSVSVFGCTTMHNFESFSSLNITPVVHSTREIMTSRADHSPMVFPKASLLAVSSQDTVVVLDNNFSLSDLKRQTPSDQQWIYNNKQMSKDWSLIE